MAIESSVTPNRVEETKHWSREQRRREVNRILIGALLLFTCVNSILNWISIVDRRKIHEAEQVTLDRLDARAEIHILMLLAYAEQRPLTTDEKNRILDLWDQARYPKHLKDILEQVRDRTAFSSQPLPSLRSPRRRADDSGQVSK